MRTSMFLVVGTALVAASTPALAGGSEADEAGKAPPGSFSLAELGVLSTSGLMLQQPPAPPRGGPPAPPPLWKIGGYAEFAYTYNFNQPDNVRSSQEGVTKENSFRIFDVDHNEFMFHSLLLDAEKQATDDSPVGFRVVAMAGQDAKWIHSSGLFDKPETVDDGIAPDGGGEDFDIIDAYLSLKIPERYFPLATTIKIGKWETHHGAEVIPSPGNWNYSRSYLFGFAIPFTHTGVMVDTAWAERGEGDTEMFGTGFGIVNGWDNVKDNNDDKSYMAQVRFSPHDIFKITAEFMAGPEGTSDIAGTGDAGDWRHLLDAVVTFDPGAMRAGLRGLTLMGNIDYGWEEAADPVGGGSASWFGFAGYGRYDFGKSPAFESASFLRNVYLGVRGEWFEDTDGFRTGINTEFMELTGTIGYRPWEPLLVRFEYRYDKADENVFNDESGGLENHQNTVAIDVIVFY